MEKQDKSCFKEVNMGLYGYVCTMLPVCKNSVPKILSNNQEARLEFSQQQHLLCSDIKSN